MSRDAPTMRIPTSMRARGGGFGLGHAVASTSGSGAGREGSSGEGEADGSGVGASTAEGGGSGRVGAGEPHPAAKPATRAIPARRHGAPGTRPPHPTPAPGQARRRKGTPSGDGGGPDFWGGPRPARAG